MAELRTPTEPRRPAGSSPAGSSGGARLVGPRRSHQRSEFARPTRTPRHPPAAAVPVPHLHLRGRTPGHAVPDRPGHGGVGLAHHLDEPVRLVVGHPHPSGHVDGSRRGRLLRPLPRGLPEMAQGPGPVVDRDPGTVGRRAGAWDRRHRRRIEPVGRVRPVPAPALGAHEAGPGRVRRRPADPARRPGAAGQEGGRARSRRPRHLVRPHLEAARHGDGPGAGLHRLRGAVHGRGPDAARS